MRRWGSGLGLNFLWNLFPSLLYHRVTTNRIGSTWSLTMKKYPPSAEELREWMDQKELSNKDVAKALRLSDGRVVRFWTSKKDPRPIPYPSWYTLRHKFGK